MSTIQTTGAYDVRVFPDRGGWRVAELAAPERSTIHGDSTEARRNADVLVRAHGGGRVIARDLYGRVHVTKVEAR